MVADNKLRGVQAAIGIAPFSENQSIVQGNLILGWKQAVSAQNTSPDGNASFLIVDNTADGTISAEGPEDRTKKYVDRNTNMSATSSSAKSK